jgi:hypothetical protein
MPSSANLVQPNLYTVLTSLIFDLSFICMRHSRELTYDERKASEAAFRGLPIDLSWTDSAKRIYEGLTRALGKIPPSDPSTPKTEHLEPHEIPALLPSEISEPSQASSSLNSGDLSEVFKSLQIRSRREAIESGILKDVTQIAQSVGLSFCVGMTNPLWDQYITASPDFSEEFIQSRLRDTLVAVRLRLASLKTPTPLVDIPVLLQFPPEPTPQLCLTFALFHKDPIDGDCLLLIHPEEVFATRQSFENN